MDAYFLADSSFDILLQIQVSIFSWRGAISKNMHIVHYNMNISILKVYNRHIYILHIQNFIYQRFDSRLSVEKYLEMVLKRVNQTIALSHKPQFPIQAPPPIKFWKTFARSHLVYGDILCSTVFNISFYRKV